MGAPGALRYPELNQYDPFHVRFLRMVASFIQALHVMIRQYTRIDLFSGVAARRIISPTVLPYPVQ